MNDYVELALTYGGYTSLDRVYLKNVLATLSDDQKLAFITPPPSVVNAYFAEIYQKQGPEAATSYFLDLSKHLYLFDQSPSFEESKPFIRLNLSGASYGFTFECDEVGLVFAEKETEVTLSRLLEVAELFPHYRVWQDQGLIKLNRLVIDETELADETPKGIVLGHVARLADHWIKISSLNQEELLELVTDYPDRTIYFGYAEREFLAYIKE